MEERERERDSVMRDRQRERERIARSPLREVSDSHEYLTPLIRSGPLSVHLPVAPIPVKVQSYSLFLAQLNRDRRLINLP